MDNVKQLEILLKILLLSYEDQLVSISLLGRHPFRGLLVEKMRRMTSYLITFIETREQDLIEKIQTSSEEVLEDSAMLISALREAKEGLPHVEVLKEITTTFANGHKKLTRTLSESEEKLTTEIIRRFSEMKKEVNAIQSSLEKI